MSEDSRVKRWRDTKRERGLKALTIWLTGEEEMRLKDLALHWHCSPSAVVQQALAQLSPTRPQDISSPTDTSQLRQLIREELATMQASLIHQLIREELAAMQATQTPVTAGVTVTPTETSAQGRVPAHCG